MSRGDCPTSDDGRRAAGVVRPGRRAFLQAAVLLPLAGAVGCSARKTDDNVANSPYALRDRGSLTIPLGDSIDGAEDIGNTYSAGSIYSTLCIQSNQRVTALYNAGIGGDNTSQVRDRMQADVIDRKPGICIVGGGVTNDHAAGASAESTRANLTAMVDALRTAGIQVVVRTCPPCDQPGGAPYNTVDARRAEIQRHNAWLAGWAAGRGFPLLDYYGPLVDETTGGYAPGQSDDGLHPSGAGQRSVVDAILAAGLPAVFAGRVPLVTSVGDAADLLTGAGLFLGKPDGGVAAGWSHYGNNARLSVVPDPGPGNLQTISNGTDTQHVLESAVLSQGFAPGDTIQFAFRVIKEGRAASYARLRFGGDGDFTGEMSPAAGQRALNGVAASRLVLPAGTKKLQVQIAADAGEKLQVGQVTVTNLNTVGLA